MISPAKAKLPHFLSYPLTAAEIQTHILAAASGYPAQYSFDISRTDKSSPPASTPVLTVRFLDRDIQFPGGILSRISSTLGYPLPRWDAVIHVVPRSSRAEIRALLFDEGFTRLHAWLQAPHSPTWFQRNHCFGIAHLEKCRILEFTEHDRNGF